mgnify:CR=1 FL=1
MTIQNSILLDPRFKNEIKHEVFLPYPEASIRVADTCKEAYRMVSDFWEQNGLTKGEFRYCILSPIAIHTPFSSQFDCLASKFPFLFSSGGMTYKGQDGIEKNAKCIYRRNASKLFLRVISKDKVEIIALEKRGNAFILEKGAYVSTYDWDIHKEPLPSLDQNVWDSHNPKDKTNYFLELQNATPLVANGIIPNVDPAEEFPLSKEFNEENQIVQFQLSLL